MNKKIIDEMLDKTGWGFGDAGDDCMQCGVFDPYKFTALIIQECIDQVGHFEYGLDREQGEFAMDVLRSHFGVE